MTSIALDHVTKSFGQTLALDGVSLAVPSGAFMALLGPSGCGKTTLLRLLAGFEGPSAGAIAFDGQRIADETHHRPPEERRVAMVFQSYALWPHMDVAENVAYPLRVAGARKGDARQQAEAALAEVGIGALGERRIEALSGGQRQRVALARALVQDADLVLCDEPLANLDVHLRASMIDTFRRLHRTSGRTFVYVTHDQAEALALATIIAVLDGGRVAQIGAPQAIYREPASEAVARFVGRGRLVDGEILVAADGRARVGLGGAEVEARCPAEARPGPARLLIRPEAVHPGGSLTGQVAASLYRGAAWETTLRLPSGDELIFDSPCAPEEGETVAVSVRDAWVVPG